MKLQKLFWIFGIVSMIVVFSGCGKKCANGCGETADSECMAEMCDDCCDYYMGLNGCYSKHYDSKWD